MRQIRYISGEPRRRNPLTQLIAFVVGLGVLVLSVVLGAFLLAALLGLALIVGTAVYLRLWWLRRKMRRDGGGNQVIEAEYTVVDEKRRDSGRR